MFTRPGTWQWIDFPRTIRVQWMIWRCCIRSSWILPPKTSPSGTPTCTWLAERCPRGLRCCTISVGFMSTVLSSLQLRETDFMAHVSTCGWTFRKEELKTYPLVNIQKTIEHHHFKWENPLQMAIFSSHVSLPEGRFVEVHFEITLYRSFYLDDFSRGWVLDFFGSQSKLPGWVLNPEGGWLAVRYDGSQPKLKPKWWLPEWLQTSSGSIQTFTTEKKRVLLCFAHVPAAIWGWVKTLVPSEPQNSW